MKAVPTLHHQNGISRLGKTNLSHKIFRNMNKVTLIGNVGKELITKNFTNGKLASFTLATNEKYMSKENKEVSNTTWHNLVAFGKVADVCERMISKGKLVSIEGKLNYRSYQNKENQTVYITEIQVYKVEEVIAKGAVTDIVKVPF